MFLNYGSFISLGPIPNFFSSVIIQFTDKIVGRFPPVFIIGVVPVLSLDGVTANERRFDQIGNDGAGKIANGVR